MKRYLFILTAACTLFAAAQAQDPNELEQSDKPTVRFAPLAVYVDTHDQPLAAYQFELQATQGRVKIVGVEGGDAPAFREPPYYDPAALMQDRIIIAAFNTSPNLPHGKTKVATLHLQILGPTEPRYQLTLTAAATSDGTTIPAEITFVPVPVQP